jgi:hypothetical protein
MDLTIEEFCELHDACEDGRDWALTHCSSMQECWNKMPYDYLRWVAVRNGVLTDVECRLFCVFCCREIWQFMTDPHWRRLVDLAELYANKQVNFYELISAADAVSPISLSVIRYTDNLPKQYYNARLAAICAGATRPVGALYATAGYACAALEAAGLSSNELKLKQMTWLRANTRPNFTREALCPT